MLAAGAILDGISRMVTSPLYVIKIRFQVQLEPTLSWELLHKDMYGSSKYTGMMQVTKDILRQKCLPGFGRGNVPALSWSCQYHIHSSPYLSYLRELNVYTTMTSTFVDILRSYKVVCHCLDVVKKRFQIIGLPRDSFYGAGVEHHAYNGISDALRCILVTEG
ncbi:hypothetical protein MKX03_016249 [Papaver bracteatum]|nr:hypothetical protein MKX03_016249 [Papaver bracteatum]